MRQYCPPITASMVINRQPLLGPAGATPPVRDSFDGACSTLPHRLCDDQRVFGALDGMVLADEALVTSTPALWLYQHSGGLQTMRVTRAGNDLAFSTP